MFGIWSNAEIAQSVARALQGHAGALDAEHAVRGLDGLKEVQLHPVVAAGLAETGIGVWREWPFPTPHARPGSPAHPMPRDRERCDLLLSPAGVGPPADPIALQAQRNEAASSLFASQALADFDESDAPDPEDLFWLEIKSVGQFVIVEGAQRPNGQYSSELVEAGRDLQKLESDPGITLGGLVLIHFTADKQTAEHDHAMVLNRWLDRGWPVRTPEVEGFAITDRIGNTWCSVVLTPIR